MRGAGGSRLGRRSRHTYLAAQYLRLAPQRGTKRAIVAVAHTVPVIICHLLEQSTVYRELGCNYFDERAREATLRRAVQCLHRLGYTVTLEAA